MKKDKTDKEFEALVKSMLSQMEPEELTQLLASAEANKNGIDEKLLSELRLVDYNPVRSKAIPCIETLPVYIDFWNEDKLIPLKEKYADFKRACNKQKKAQLTQDINDFLLSIPYNYLSGESLLSSDLWMIAAMIVKHDRKMCHHEFVNILRHKDDFIEDTMMDDEAGSIQLFAEIGYDCQEDLIAIATDPNVMPYARGIAIAALAKISTIYPEYTLVIQNAIRSIFNHYRTTTSEKSTIKTAMVRAISMIAARIHFSGLLPEIREAYKELKISKEGMHKLKNVEAIMDSDKMIDITNIDSIISYLDFFLDFQSRFNIPTEEELDDWEDEDDDWEDEDDDWDDEDDDWEDEYEDEDDEDDFDYGKIQIFQKDISNAHPKGLVSHTDRAYCELAKDLCGVIVSAQAGVTASEVKAFAIKSALYFEDVLADVGIWRSFVNKIKEMYGKTLPFYNIDEEDYYSDEPNVEDIQLLIWMTRADMLENAVANPGNPGLHNIAVAIFDHLMEVFEEMPVNEKLHDFFAKAEFMKSFFETRDVLKWAYLSSYLTATIKAYNSLVDFSDEFEKFLDTESYYHAESTVIYTENIGPLALKASEWVAMILEANDRVDDANTVRNMKAKQGFYHVENRKGKIFSVHSDNDERFEINRKNFGYIIPQQMSIDYFFANIATFKGEYYLSGTTAWDPLLKEEFDNQFEKFENRKRIGVPNYEEIMKDSGDSPIFYFKNHKEVVEFMKEKVGMNAKDANKIPTMDAKDEPWIVFLPGKHSPFLYMPKAATCFADPKNPYFNEEIAKEKSLETAFNIPYILLCYAMEHNLLPYAGFNCISGEEYGRKQFQENYDFTIRCICPNSLDEPS